MKQLRQYNDANTKTNLVSGIDYTYNSENNKT